MSELKPSSSESPPVAGATAVGAYSLVWHRMDALHATQLSLVRELIRAGRTNGATGAD